MGRLRLADLRHRYVVLGRPLPNYVEVELRADPRAGARAILDSVARRRERNRSEGQRLRMMLQFERTLWDEGILRVAGVDEAGMSPLAGPVVAAAVILPVGGRIREVDDSKRLDPETRERLAVDIREVAVAWAVGRAEPAEIDRHNIHNAGLLAMRRAVEGLDVRPQHVLVDGRARPQLALPMQAIIKGDQKSLSIAAASILAKTTRDAEMVAYDAEFPGYGFAQHKGYPVQAHQEALRRLGPLPIHRRSFAAVREALATVGPAAPPRPR